MATEIVVVGAGGFGRETLDVIEAINEAGRARFDVLGVADDSPSEANVERLRARGYRVLGTIREVVEAHRAGVFAAAIGDPTVRRVVADRLAGAGWAAATLIHPAAVVGSAAEIREGTIVCAGVQVSTNVRIGRHVHLKPNATIGHDTRLASYVSVNPGAVISGDVDIEADVLVGAGAVVLQGLRIGASSTVGASSCLTKDLPPGAVAKGVPARWT